MLPLKRSFTTENGRGSHRLMMPNGAVSPQRCKRRSTKRTHAARSLVSLLCVTFVVLAVGCRSAKPNREPSILFDHVPPDAPGGPGTLERITGRVIGAPAGARIVVYARSNFWWVQPFRDKPFTQVGADGSWSSFSHLGSGYAALLVTAGFEPPTRVPKLPAAGGEVLAVATANGSAAKPVAPKVVHFSGYDWTVRSAPGNHGGELTDYEPSNVWVDDHGYLHLLMSQEEGHWHCAGASLSRSLGYGIYRFVVQDSALLPPSAVLAMFTRDDRQNQEDRIEMDIELSRWGKATNQNADYVVQPYYIPENTVHFNVPKGPVTYVLHWSPGNATFQATAGDSSRPGGRELTSHVFKAGVPVPASETVRLDFYDFRHAQSGLQHPAEVVLEKFEYLP
jgi:hypothetical protein